MILTPSITKLKVLKIVESIATSFKMSELEANRSTLGLDQ
jgi:hypothetical protein